jgi:multidrug efflux pump subunit AcrA (membrane-fusion protein)
VNKRVLLNGFLVVVLVAAGVGTYLTVHSTKSSASTTSTTATAKRGIVLSSVTSTGNVEAPTDLSLSFQQSGQVTAISVTVGEHVKAHQRLAKVDDTEQKMALASAQSGLASAQSSLAALQRGETAVERQSDAMSALASAQGITSAQQGVTDAQQNATTNLAKYTSAVTQAQSTLTSANSDASAAQTDLNQAEQALSRLQATADPRHSSSATIATTITRYQADASDCQSHAGETTASDGVSCAQVNNLMTYAKAVQAAQTSLTQVQSQQSQARDGLTSAQQAQAGGEAQDQQAIQQAQNQLTSAQTQYQSTLVGNAVKQQPPKPEELAQAQAQIVSANAQLATAQKNEDDTTLKAPVAGVVSTINGVVGQQSGSGSSSASSSASSASSNSSSSSSSSSGSGFIDLTNVSVLDVQVGFTETDAPKVHVGQAATVTLDALPNQTFVGHVLSLDTTSTLVSNVVTYYAKVGFDTAPVGVKPGMTASVNVVLDKRDNVVTLPTSAVSTTGTSETVTVRAKDGTQSSRVITIGLRGDNAVEITNGLSAGDQVVVTTTAAATGTGGFGARLGGGGLGGGGLGGGLGGAGGGLGGGRG